MVNGLYSSAAGMMHLQRKQDVNANNMANATTTGFKKSRLLTNTTVTNRYNNLQKLHHDEDQKMDEVYTDYAQGSLIQTDNDLDFALHGKGFFVVMTNDGVRYTRKGNFILNPQGDLVTLNGDNVLKRNGDTIRMTGKKLQITNDGGIFVDGEKIGMLGVYEFADSKQLRAQGNGYFENLDPENNPAEPSEKPVVRQGYMEGSNVDIISSMVQMISLMKNYEASQKALHAIDETLNKAVNDVGRVG